MALHKLKSDIVEIYESRSVLYALIRRDLVGRYKYSTLGFAWHFFIPLIMLCIYYIIFSEIRKSPIEDFSVYLLSGLFPFTFLNSNLSGGAGCITSNASMVKKMYFPREILILSQGISSFIIMLIGFSASCAFILLTGFSINLYSVIIVPMILILELIFVLGFVSIISSINVYHRDVQHFLSSISLVFFFTTPIYFTMEDVSEPFSSIIWLNPFTYYIDSLHQCIYYGSYPSTTTIICCIAISLITFLIGYVTFNRLKRGFAERL